ncbi:MAG: alpha/beta hydrolase [Anaerolineae bacterium]|jgi:hypothetical protein|nr:alpha/beta hydrolase [Anaerolineae bacterium]
MDIVTKTEWIAGVPALSCYDADAAAGLPLVLVLHGFTGRKEDSLGQATALARRGYYAVAIDAHLHGELGARPFDPAQVAARMAEIAVVTAGALGPLIAAFSAEDGPADAGRVGLIGTSMGGAIICHYLPQRHPAVKAAVAMIAGIPAIWPTVLRNARPLYPSFGVTDEMIREAEQIPYPPFLEGVDDFPLLMQYGEADPLIPIDAIREIHAQVSAHSTGPAKLVVRTYPDVGHETPPRMVAEAMAWLARYV